MTAAAALSLSIRRESVSLLRLALPMVVSRAGIAGMGIADSVMVARYSPGQMAIMGLAEGTLGRVLDIGFAFLLAGIVLAARAMADGTPAAAGGVWRLASWLALGFGCIGILLGSLAPIWLPWLHQPDDLATGAVPLLLVIGLSMPFALFAIVSAVFLETIGRPTIAAWAVIGANIINLGMNWLLIGGHAGLPAWGALGSIVSTSVVRVVMAGAFAVYIFRLPERARLGITAASGPSLAGPQLRLGAGAAATACVLSVLGLAVTVITGWLGALAMAASGTLWSALSIGALASLGIADATAIRVAGATDHRSGTVAACVSMAIVAAIAALVAVPLVVWPGEVAGLYATAEPLRLLLAAILPLGALLLILDSVGFVLGASLRGLSEAAWPTAIHIAIGITLVPLAYWLAISRDGGIVGLLIAMAITGFLRLLCLGARLWVRTHASVGAGQLAPLNS